MLRSLEGYQIPTVTGSFTMHKDVVARLGTLAKSVATVPARPRIHPSPTTSTGPLRAPATSMGRLPRSAGSGRLLVSVP